MNQGRPAGDHQPHTRALLDRGIGACSTPPTGHDRPGRSRRRDLRRHLRVGQRVCLRVGPLGQPGRQPDRQSQRERQRFGQPHHVARGLGQPVRLP